MALIDRTIDERQAALALRLSGEALFATGATDDAARELLAAAKVLMAFDPPLARQTTSLALTAQEPRATQHGPGLPGHHAPDRGTWQQ